MIGVLTAFGVTSVFEIVVVLNCKHSSMLAS